ncbi:uncharacterized protein N7479_006068 [Penicillium vulpinum]|uniref:uncharacterized protein n=1 Tax=Penicillium vulpinum TaxID=29845 RepID=UPI002549A4D5|nr:uncharacterized protein N7479_006068 [Penicillium vulpinum]KAJ5958918.1 hypothetical protein N7479_006068 [Penicillium vulpinum]
MTLAFIKIASAGYHYGGLERHEIQKRWFGEDVLNWLAELIFVGEAEATKKLNHHVNEKFELLLIDQQFGPCPVGPAQVQANVRSSITAKIDIETSFGFTIIATLKEGMDLKRPYLYFRNAGEINAKFELDAVVSLTYSTGDIKLLGLDDFPGATFRVPGLVTVGPNLAVYASSEASFVVAGHLEADNAAHPDQALDEPNCEAKTIGKPFFDASVTANGKIALYLKSTVTFGIDFDNKWKVPRCAVDLVLDGYNPSTSPSFYSSYSRSAEMSASDWQQIYSYYPPHAFACVDHHRCEIAHRKQQHRSEASNPPPLIPQFFRPSNDTPVGFCILLRSHSYRIGYTEDRDELAGAGDDPGLLYFNRCFSNTRNHVVEALRSSDSEGELSPEALELSTERVMCQIDLGQIIMCDVFLNAGSPSLQYALDVDEGEPPDPNPPPEEQLHEQLDQEMSAGGFSLDPSFQVSQNADVVTITNTSEGNDPDMHYLVYAPFLSYLRNSVANKILNLEFFIPESNSWSAIGPAHTEALSHQQTNLPIGALHTFCASEDDLPAPHYISPQLPEESLSAARKMLRTPFRMFAVVLDRANFVSQAGIFFYMTNFDALNDPDLNLEVSPDDTQIRRGVGISEVARRLAMSAVNA